MAGEQRKRSFWTWGHVTDEPTQAVREKVAASFARRTGVHVEPPPIPNLADIPIRPARLTVPNALRDWVSTDHEERRRRHRNPPPRRRAHAPRRLRQAASGLVCASAPWRETSGGSKRRHEPGGVDRPLNFPWNKFHLLATSWVAVLPFRLPATSSFCTMGLRRALTRRKGNTATQLSSNAFSFFPARLRPGPANQVRGVAACRTGASARVAPNGLRCVRPVRVLRW